MTVGPTPHARGDSSTGATTSFLSSLPSSVFGCFASASGVGYSNHNGECRSRTGGPNSPGRQMTLVVTRAGSREPHGTGGVPEPRLPSLDRETVAGPCSPAPVGVLHQGRRVIRAQAGIPKIGLGRMPAPRTPVAEPSQPTIRATRRSARIGLERVSIRLSPRRYLSDDDGSLRIKNTRRLCTIPTR